jgi:predicted O-methyltransferase YrrM
MNSRTRRGWLVGAAVVVAAAALAAWVRQAVLPFRGLPPSPALVILRGSSTNGGVSAADGRLLHDIILQRRYTRGLDLGTAEGYGAIWMATALRRTGGSLVTIEIDPVVAARARENFREARVDDVVELHVADAVAEVPRLPGDFDFVFMDLGVPLNRKLLDLLWERIRPAGTIAAHNAELFRWTQPDFLEAITNDPRLETSFHGLVFRISTSVKRR